MPRFLDENVNLFMLGSGKTAQNIGMRRLVTVAMVAAMIISLGGWLWFLGATIRWLIIKL
jgi:hypothetical protein